MSQAQELAELMAKLRFAKKIPTPKTDGSAHTPDEIRVAASSLTKEDTKAYKKSLKAGGLLSRREGLSGYYPDPELASDADVKKIMKVLTNAYSQYNGQHGYDRVVVLARKALRANGSGASYTPRDVYEAADGMYSEILQAVDDLIEDGHVSTSGVRPAKRKSILEGLTVGSKYGDSILDGPGADTMYHVLKETVKRAKHTHRKDDEEEEPKPMSKSKSRRDDDVADEKMSSKSKSKSRRDEEVAAPVSRSKAPKSPRGPARTAHSPRTGRSARSPSTGRSAKKSKK